MDIRFIAVFLLIKKCPRNRAFLFTLKSHKRFSQSHAQKLLTLYCALDSSSYIRYITFLYLNSSLLLKPTPLPQKLKTIYNPNDKNTPPQAHPHMPVQTKSSPALHLPQHSIISTHPT